MTTVDTTAYRLAHGTNPRANQDGNWLFTLADDPRRAVWAERLGTYGEAIESLPATSRWVLLP